jgi:hypothetical protein
MADNGFVYKLYRYVPSIPAAAVTAAVFGVLAMGHLYRIVNHRAYFFVPFIIGLLCMSSQITIVVIVIIVVLIIKADSSKLKRQVILLASSPTLIQPPWVHISSRPC